MLTYDQLTVPEQTLWDAFPKGRWADLRTGTPDEDDPVRGGSWGPERTVRAEVVAALLLGANTRQEATVATLRLAGARITGRLELDEADIDHALWLDGCHVEDEISMTGTTIRTVCVRHSRLRRFDARMARVNGRFLIEHSYVDGQLSLIDARVAGSLHLSGSTISLPGDWALFAGGLQVGGALFARRNFTVHGGTRLVGAQLPSGLLLEGAQLGTGWGKSLCADRAAITPLVCTDGFTADATITLRGTRIADLLTFEGAFLKGEGVALDCAQAQIGDFRFALAARPVGTVDLRDARTGVLQTPRDCWPRTAYMQGLTYDTLESWSAEAPDPVADRVAWLRSTPGYAPQPYEQLAAWYRKIGHDNEARRVLLDKQRHRRRTLHAAGRVWGRLLDITVGYGYRPWRAGIWLLALTLLGTLVFPHQHPVARDPARGPVFHALPYTLDLLIPIGGLGQRNAWYWTSSGTQWLAYGLIAAGWLLTTAVVAGVTRQLSRN